MSNKKIKILGIVCSARQNGNTELLMKEALESAKKFNPKEIETILITLAGKDIVPCDACDTCHELNKCKINDYITEVLELMKDADAIIIGSPIYIHNISAQAKILMDRTNALYTEDGESLLKDKIGAAIVVGQERQGGKAIGLISIISFFLAHHMIVIGGSVPESYPGVSGWTFESTEKDAIKKDTDAIIAARNLGWRVAHLATILKGTKLSEPVVEE